MLKKITENSEILAANNSYVTPEGKSGIFLTPSLTFYYKLFRIVFYSNRKVKKGYYDGINWAESSLDIKNRLEESGVKFSISGLENLRDIKAPVVFVSNHMSTLETMILPGIIQPVMDVTFIVKRELTTYPLFGPILKSRDPIVVGRENPRDDLVAVFGEGKKILQQGKSIIVFPQRTRVPYFDPSEFNTLGNKLAEKNSVPVIPVALVTDAWGIGSMVKELGKIDTSKTVHIAFGKVIPPGTNSAVSHSATKEFIEAKFREWGRTDILR